MQLARHALAFASKAIGSKPEGMLDDSSNLQTAAQSSCSLSPSRVDCWCGSSSASSCPWEPVVNPHVLGGIMQQDDLPLSLAAAVEQVSVMIGALHVC